MLPVFDMVASYHAGCGPGFYISGHPIKWKMEEKIRILGRNGLFFAFLLLSFCFPFALFFTDILLYFLLFVIMKERMKTWITIIYLFGFVCVS